MCERCVIAMPLIRQKKDHVFVRIFFRIPIGNGEGCAARRTHEKTVGPEKFEGGVHSDVSADPMDLVDKVVAEIFRYDAVTHTTQFARSRRLTACGPRDEIMMKIAALSAAPRKIA